MVRSTVQLIPSLDGLRAVSVALVIFSHLINGHQVGLLGVRVFFVISGYLITYLLLKEFNSTGGINLKRFYFRRTLRIFAPFYFYLFIVGILGVFNVIPLRRRDLVASFTYTSNYLVPISLEYWYTVHSWSLSVEEQFYLLYPSLFIFLRKSRVLLVLAFILFLAPVLRVINFHFFPEPQYYFGYYIGAALFYGFHANMDALASGCLLAFLAEYDRTRNILLKVASIPQTVVIIACVFIYFANMQLERPNYFFTVCYTFMNTTIALIIYWAIVNSESRFLGRVLNTKVLSFVGVLSYSLYLWQQLFTGKEMLSYFPLNVLLTFACALVSYYTIEKYSLKLRTYLENRSLSKSTQIIKPKI